MSEPTDTERECTWTDDGDGTYLTECGQMHFFPEGGPKENYHKFCPYCGGVLKEAQALTA